MEHLAEVEATIETLSRWNREACGRAAKATGLPIAIDEWNELGWELFDSVPKNDLPETYTLAGAIYTAGFLNAMIRHAADVTMANYSPAVNTRGLIYAGERGIILRPAYHVFRMFRPAAGGTAVKAAVDCPSLPGSRAPALDVSAVLDEGKALRLLVVNRHPHEAVDCAIDLGGREMLEGTVEVLTGESLDSFNDFEAPARVAPAKIAPAGGRAPLRGGAGGLPRLELPSRSVSVVRLGLAARPSTVRGSFGG
jgi:alpha-L-arabinofuranosidase